MLLLFSQGRSLSTRTQPPSPSSCISSISILLAPCFLDDIQNFVIYSSFCCFLMENLSLISLFLWIQQWFSKLVWYNTLKWNFYTRFTFTYKYWVFQCLFLLFACVFPHIFASSLSCLFHAPPPFHFPSFYKSVPVWSHTSPAPDCVSRKIKCCQSFELCKGKLKAE